MRRVVIIAVVIAAVALILGVVVPPLFNSPSRIAAKAAGTWQEIGQTPAYTMQVVGAGSTYLVTYPRWQYDAEGFSLTGDKLLGGGGENIQNDRVKTITYDNGSDELTISDKSGDHVFAFSRVRRRAGTIGVMREVGGPAVGPRRMPDTPLEVHWATLAGPIVAGATSGRSGRFKVTVAPGRYVVVPVAGGDEVVVPDSVVVEPGVYVVAKPLFSVR